MYYQSKCMLCPNNMKYLLQIKVLTYFVTWFNNSGISQFRTKWDKTVRNCDTVFQQCLSSFLFNLTMKINSDYMYVIK